MERIRSCARPTGMTKQSRIRGLTAAGLLCLALAGCGTVAATSPPTSTPPATTPPALGAGSGTTLATAATRETGCASVNQATSVTVTRSSLLAEPANGSTRTVTQRRATVVRALFGDFCAAIAHADIPQPVMRCPADFGISYFGKFYDRQRILATFSYSPSGCPRLSLTVSGKTRGTLLIGKAAAAAPHLKADLAAVLGVPQWQVSGPPAQTLAPARQGM
jgi:hypothetical protein